jgi:hypothetical protein
MNAGDAEQTEGFDIVAYCAACRCVGFHEQRKRRAARDGFKAQSAGAREQVEHAPSRQTRRPWCMCEHVEQGFAGAVTGGSRVTPLWRNQAAPLQCSADNAHNAILLLPGERGLAANKKRLALDAYLTLRE